MVDRRAQYLVVDSTRVSTRADDEIVLSDEDEEALVGHFDEHDQEAQCIPTRAGPPQDEFVGQLEWDEDSIASNLLDPAAASLSSEQSPLVISESFQVHQASSKCFHKSALPGMSPASLPKLGETTPLLANNPHEQIPRKVATAEHHYSNVPCHVVRRLSNGSIQRSVKSISTRHGQSTFGQTVSWSRCALNLT